MHADIPPYIYIMFVVFTAATALGVLIQAGILPVSYTHLDVYKRQEQDLAFDGTVGQGFEVGEGIHDDNISSQPIGWSGDAPA